MPSNRDAHVVYDKEFLSDKRIFIIPIGEIRVLSVDSG